VIAFRVLPGVRDVWGHVSILQRQCRQRTAEGWRQIAGTGLFKAVLE